MIPPINLALAGRAGARLGHPPPAAPRQQERASEKEPSQDYSPTDIGRGGIAVPRRKARIDLARSAHGQDFSLSETQRAQVEARFGHKLSPLAWKQVQAYTLLFVVGMSAIKSAMPLKDILKKLRKLATAARSLRQEISGEPCPDSTNLSLKDIHQKYLQEVQPLYLTPVLLGLLDAISAVSIFAEESMKEVGKGNLTIPHENFSEDEWWSIWVGLMEGVMSEHGLPYQARKDSDKQKQESSSPFVLFVSELQKQMPVECQKYTHSFDALAQAIHRARRMWREGSGPKKS
jgi:hypothetical protein